MLQQILENFLMEKPKKTVFGNYRIEGNSLIYRASVTIEKEFKPKDLKGFTAWSENYHVSEEEKERVISHLKNRDWDVKAKGTGNEVNEIARKTKGGILGNSSILDLVGRTVAYGNETRNRDVTEIQKRMASNKNFIMIPFSVFDEAGLDLNNFLLVQRGKEEVIKVKIEEYDWTNGKRSKITKIEKRHFTGASLFSVDGAFYLFDLDRREVKHKIFNPFLAKLPKEAKSIKAAYEALKPKAVKEAEKNGLKVLRQGEWFFIETTAPKIETLSDIEKMTVVAGANTWSIRELAPILNLSVKSLAAISRKLLAKLPRPQNLQAGNSRPNEVSRLLKQGRKVFCTGTVKHSGREHAPLKLMGWFLAVPNTATKNFTVTGDID